MAGAGPGTFLLRVKKDSDGAFVLTVWQGTECWHGIIDESAHSLATGEQCFMLRGTGNAQNSLEDLVRFYCRHPYSKTDGVSHYLTTFFAGR